MDSVTRSVIALTTTGVLGPWLDERNRDPLSADEALNVVHVFTAAGVPPTPYSDDEHVPMP